MKAPGGARTGAECERDTFVAATAEHDQADYALAKEAT